MGNPYLNTYDSRCQYHPYLSWEINQYVPQFPQAKESNLEDAISELDNSLAEFKTFKIQMATSCLREVMAELAKSQIDLAKSQAQFVEETRVVFQI